MKHLVQAVLGSALVVIFLQGSFGYAQGSKLVTVEGKAAPTYTKVGLFSGGSSKHPYKVVNIGADGRYSMTIDLANETVEKNGGRMADMRFFGDQNNNNIMDPKEKRSRCHFIMTDAALSRTMFEPYEQHPRAFNGPKLQYDYME